MKSLRDLSQDDGGLFGPGTDLTLSLVAILMVFLFVMGRYNSEAAVRNEKIKAEIGVLQEQLAESQGRLAEREGALQQCKEDLEACRRDRQLASLDIAKVQENQRQMIESLANGFGTRASTNRKDHFAIATSVGVAPSIFVENDATLQRIRFGSHILFESDEHSLRQSGERILRVVARGLHANRSSFNEIRIQGHADIETTRKYRSNLDLASRRALEVFEFLRENGVDPFSNLMSATSFGEFYPTERRDMTHYNHSLLEQHNRTTAMKMQNRRIEIELVYRR